MEDWFKRIGCACLNNLIFLIFQLILAPARSLFTNTGPRLNSIKYRRYFWFSEDFFSVLTSVVRFSEFASLLFSFFLEQRQLIVCSTTRNGSINKSHGYELVMDYTGDAFF
jgi:hypothetical protein